MTPTEWAVLTVLREHRYDYRDKGAKPDDPGWHRCSCGWEGYWSGWQPHVAENVTQTVRTHVVNLVDPVGSGVEVKQAVLDLLAAAPADPEGCCGACRYTVLDLDSTGRCAHCHSKPCQHNRDATARCFAAQNR